MHGGNHRLGDVADHRERIQSLARQGVEVFRLIADQFQRLFQVAAGAKSPAFATHQPHPGFIVRRKTLQRRGEIDEHRDIHRVHRFRTIQGQNRDMAVAGIGDEWFAHGYFSCSINH